MTDAVSSVANEADELVHNLRQAVDWIRESQHPACDPRQRIGIEDVDADEIEKAANLIERQRADRERAWKAGFRAGFEASGEGYNGEYPFEGIDVEEDPQWVAMRDRIYSGEHAND